LSETIEPQAVRAAAPPTPIGLHGGRLPTMGEWVERLRNGVSLRGEVFYSDGLQLLVKWDDGSSSSLRLDKPLPWPLRTINADEDADAA
jgi:hypothetical protein